VANDSEFEIKLELSPEMLIVLSELCSFYHKDKRQVIEMALEQLASDAKLIVDTMAAKRAGNDRR